jgi:hypothetical protein
MIKPADNDNLIDLCTFLNQIQVVKDISEAVQTPGEVHHLAEFFTARLKDW